MIKLTLAAGLGNQMFEYAYARALSEEFKDPNIVINQYYNRIWKLWSKIMKSDPSYVNFSLNKYRNLTEKGKFHFLDKAYTYYEHGECRKKNKSVYGWFFSEKYFSNIRPILLKEFQFKEGPLGKNKEMAEELSSCNSVCVHIRRGDITNSRYSKTWTTPNEDYYKKGIAYISKHTENPAFYVFSNNHEDIEWIKHNYDFGVPVKYVDLNNPGIEDLRLMYYCKHFVISKSAFSWWGSYMSQNDDKIIIAPVMKKDNWLKDANMEDWYRKDMIRFRSEAEGK